MEHDPMASERKLLEASEQGGSTRRRDASA